MSVRELKPKLILKITYIQLIFPLKMFKSNPAKNTIADNLDNKHHHHDNDHDKKVKMAEINAMMINGPWREVQHVRK